VLPCQVKSSHLQNNDVLSSSSLQLWFAQVGEITAPIEYATLQHLTSSEQHRLQATSNDNKRREFLLSRALMRHALDEHIKPQQQKWQFVEKANAPPLITNLPDGLHISLTHSKGTICFALASCSVGVDLEKMRGNRDFMGLAKTVMNAQEIEFFKRQPKKLIENFYRIWCTKEARYKALPIEKQVNLSLKNIAVLPFFENKNVLITKRNTDFMLAITLQKKVASISYNHFPKNDVTTAQFVAALSDDLTCNE